MRHARAPLWMTRALVVLACLAAVYYAGHIIFGWPVATPVP